MLLGRSGPRKGSKGQVDEESFVYSVSSVRVYCSAGWLWCSYELRMTLNFSSYRHVSGVGRVGVSYRTRFLWYEGSNSECLLYTGAKYSPMELGWFAWQTSSVGSCIWKLGGQLVAAYRGNKNVEGFNLVEEEAEQQRQAWKVCSPTPFPALSVSCLRLRCELSVAFMPPPPSWTSSSLELLEPYPPSPSSLFILPHQQRSN